MGRIREELTGRITGLEEQNASLQQLLRGLVEPPPSDLSEIDQLHQALTPPPEILKAKDPALVDMWTRAAKERLETARELARLRGEFGEVSKTAKTVTEQLEAERKARQESEANYGRAQVRNALIGILARERVRDPGLVAPVFMDRLKWDPIGQVVVFKKADGTEAPADSALVPEIPDWWRIPLTTQGGSGAGGGRPPEQPQSPEQRIAALEAQKTAIMNRTAGGRASQADMAEIQKIQRELRQLRTPAATPVTATRVA